MWNLVLVQGLPLFILGAVNHNRTLEIIGFALLVLYVCTGWPGLLGRGPVAVIGRRAHRAPGGTDEKSPDDDPF